jgi:hypothetical protein
VKLSESTKQQDLVITRWDEPTVVADNLGVAQFVYLLLHNEKIRDVIDTVGKKGVLLLGRFAEGGIKVLERLRDELRKRGYVPIVFNFDKPETKDGGTNRIAPRNVLPVPPYKESLPLLSVSILFKAASKAGKSS